MISLGALVPHPPVMMAGVGQPDDLSQVAETIQSMQTLDRMLAEDPPETLVVFTPHGSVFRDAIIIYGEPVLSGNLRQFGLARTWEWETDLPLAQTINGLGIQANLPVYIMDHQSAAQYRIKLELDHGVLAPLSFFSPAWAGRSKLVIIPLSYLPLEELYQFGSLVTGAATKLGRKIAVIASGDLSHCLKPGAPAEYHPRGAEFDQKIIELLKMQQVQAFFNLDPVLLEKAAECGFRSLIMLLGVFDGNDPQITVHSYQGPFGVGYAVASFKPGNQKDSLLPVLFKARAELTTERRHQETPLVKLARSIVEAYARGIALPSLKDSSVTENLTEFFTQRAGTFVSIKKYGQLRGCIGTTEPTQENIATEVIQNAISASARDPRFSHIEPEELVDLVYSVDVLKPAEPITGLEELDPERYGVIVSKGHRRGLLLPNLEGVETAAQQVAIAKQKAGIGATEAVDLERFEVIRYH